MQVVNDSYAIGISKLLVLVREKEAIFIQYIFTFCIRSAGERMSEQNVTVSFTSLLTTLLLLHLPFGKTDD
jgi:hypothetical protein